MNVKENLAYKEAVPRLAAFPCAKKDLIKILR
jgi:hypothetical protein